MKLYNSTNKLNKYIKTFTSMILFALSLVFTDQVVATPITGLYYTSSSSSWVGHGETVIITPSDGFNFNVFRNFDHGPSFWITDYFTNPDFWSTRSWALDFAAPLGRLLQVGQYLNATRFGFQSLDVPGLSFTGNGRGDNQNTGYFDVLEISYGTGGEFSSFAADFTQFDENNTNWWNRGSIRFNSSIPLISVPEPHSLALFAIGFIGLIGSLTLRSKRHAANSAPLI